MSMHSPKTRLHWTSAGDLDGDSSGGLMHETLHPARRWLSDISICLSHDMPLALLLYVRLLLVYTAHSTLAAHDTK